MADQNCAHSGCNCKVEQGKGISKGANTYCSDRCANVHLWLRRNANADIRVASKYLRGKAI